MKLTSTKSTCQHGADLKATASLVFAAIMLLIVGCSQPYQIINYPVPYKSNARYRSFMMIETNTGAVNDVELNSITRGVEKSFLRIGLRKDSLEPELLVIARAETHQVGQIPSASNKESMHTHRVENTFEQLKRNSEDGNVSNYDKESFYRVQAIDAGKKELVWSVKIYPDKNNGIGRKSMHDLMQSFKKVQSKNDKMER